MENLEIYKRTLNKQANRIANLTLDLDLAHSQIDILQAELNQMKEERKKPKNKHI